MRFLLSLFACAITAAAQTASYPANVVTNNQLRVARNLVSTNLTSAISNSSTTLSVASGAGIVVNGLLTIDSEIVAVCSVAGTTVTIGKSTCPNIDGRGFDSTAATSHLSGARISIFVDAWYHNAVAAEIIAIEAALGPNLINVLAGTPQPAHYALLGPISGGSSNPTYRLIQPVDLPATLSSNTTGTASGFTGILAGDVTGTQAATVVGSTGGIPFAPSATLDTTVANNITHGTLPAARLPMPTPSALGGVDATDCSGSAQFIQSINSDGTSTCGTPSGGGNVSGPGAVTNGFIAAWGASNNLLTTGYPASVNGLANAVPIANSSGVLNASYLPAFSGDVTSTSGTSVLSLPNVLSSPGVCGDSAHVCAVITDAKGRITAQAVIPIISPAGGTAGNLQANFSGVLIGIGDFNYASPHTIASTASGVLDLHLMPPANLFLPGMLDGFVKVTVSTGVVSSVTAPTSALVGISDTQTLTNKSISGPQINSGVVGSTFGGTGADLHASSGIVFAGNPFTAANLSGDVTTSGAVATVGKVNGVTYPSLNTTDQVPVITAANVATYESIVNCGDATHALAYSTSTHTFSCQAITAAAGAVSLDSILAAGGANTIANGDNAQVWNWALTTASKAAFTFGETTASSAPAPILLQIATKSTSTAIPLQVTAGGTANGVQLGPSGILTKLGSGQVNADHYAGSATVQVANGGTGATTFTIHGVIVGETTSALAATAAGGLDTFLQGQGGSADPAFAAVLNCGDATHALSYSTSSHAFGCQAITASAAAGGSNGQIQFNSTTALGGAVDLTWDGTHTLAVGANGVVDLHAINNATHFTMPGALATGLVTVTTSTGAVSSVAAPVGAVVGTSDTQTLTNKLIDASEITSGLLPITRGGTGQTTASAAFNALSPITTLGDIIYGSGSNSATRLAGNTTTTQQYLCQQGNGTVSAAPAWCTIMMFTAVGSETNIVLTIQGSNTIQPAWQGTLAAGRLNANVVQAVTPDTNIGGSISAQNLTLTWSGTLAVPRGGTGLASYTSGGIPYASSSTTLASSAALGANLPVFGGGAGVAPFTGTRTGNTTQVATWTGATTASRCIHTDASGNLTVTGADCAAGTAFGAQGDFFATTDGAGAVYGPGWVFTGTQMLVFLGGVKQRPSGNDFTASANGIFAATYNSGISATGSAGQTCTISSFNGGGSSATATIALTGTNTIAFGTSLAMTAAGSGYTSPTSATASSGSATCSGTVALNSASVGSAVSFINVPASGLLVEVIQ